ncbi:hypothetical protein J1614_002441 [Plenodomus biglobosus]|nr:hypothetical protein J1614_002441 [Plenodomus biglobosus]
MNMARYKWSQPSCQRQSDPTDIPRSLHLKVHMPVEAYAVAVFVYRYMATSTLQSPCVQDINPSNLY